MKLTMREELADILDRLQGDEIYSEQALDELEELIFRRKGDF